MADRITSKVLDRKVERLNMMLPHLEHGIVLDRTNNGYRLEAPEGYPWFPNYLGRLSAREMERGIEAMMTLLEYQKYGLGGFVNGE